jgi:hypothetical protein
MGKRWQAQIYYAGKQHSLGTFNTTQEAAFAYDSEARQCGENKDLNFESTKAAKEAAAQAKAGYTLVHDFCSGPKQLRPRPPSGFYGVYADRKRWKAKLSYGSKTHNLGSYDTKPEAALAYDRAVRKCGENKPLNYDSLKAAERAVVTRI